MIDPPSARSSSQPVPGALKPGTQLYARKSSGLVREMGFGASIAVTFSFMSLPLAVLVATGAPAALANAQPFWVTLIAAAVAFFPTYLYSYFLGVMPRSGGDYVFISRTLHPWIGFAANFSLIAWLMLAGVAIVYQVGPLGLSAGFATIAVTTGSHTFAQWATDVAGTGWSFGIGAAVLVLTALVMSLRTRVMLRVMWALLGLSMLGIVFSLIVLALSSRADFMHAVARFGGNYNQIIKSARADGWAGHSNLAHFNLGNVLLATPLAFASYGYAFLGAYAGGEVRSPRTTGRRAMLAAWGLFGIIGSLLMLLASRTFGADFLGAATHLSNSGSHSYPFAAPSFFFFYVAMLVHWTPLVVVISLSFSFALIALAPATFLIGSRSLFAWSFDRILPTRLSTVSARTGTPILANIVLLIVGLIYLALVAFGSGTFLELFFTAAMGTIATFVIVGIAGMVLPYRRPDLYAISPLKRSIAGIPAISILAAVATMVWVFMLVAWATQTPLGANTTNGWTAAAVIVGIGIVIYPVSYLINRARGVDLKNAFTELPPE
jgi:basic amino acid/polyamine antiporter, APA family